MIISGFIKQLNVPLSYCMSLMRSGFRYILYHSIQFNFRGSEETQREVLSSIICNFLFRLIFPLSAAVGVSMKSAVWFSSVRSLMLKHKRKRELSFWGCDSCGGWEKNWRGILIKQFTLKEWWKLKSSGGRELGQENCGGSGGKTRILAFADHLHAQKHIYIYHTTGKRKPQKHYRNSLKTV